MLELNYKANITSDDEFFDQNKNLLYSAALVVGAVALYFVLGLFVYALAIGIAGLSSAAYQVYYNTKDKGYNINLDKIEADLSKNSALEKVQLINPDHQRAQDGVVLEDSTAINDYANRFVNPDLLNSKNSSFVESHVVARSSQNIIETALVPFV